MKLYKNQNNEIFAYELDGSQDHLISNNLISITQEEADQIIQDKTQAEQLAYVNSLTYQEKRALEYPPITDYLDGVVKNDQAQIDKYIVDCLAIKAKYPKE